MEFKEYIITIMKEKNLKTSDLSRTFAVSIPTVNRWISGVNAPHPIMQEAVKKTLGMTQSEEPTCNLCGESCVLGHPDSPARGAHGLVKQSVNGGYESTPGNGYGALDDMTRYTFSLCEFCLDWLFTQFIIPVSVTDIACETSEEWKPAEQRVASDDWRDGKNNFNETRIKRDKARNKNGNS